MHYMRWWVHGDVSWERPDATTRFWEKVDKNGPVPEYCPELGPCWMWLAFCDVHGYGKFGGLDWRQVQLAHRFSFELLVGPIPKGLTLDHLCRNPRCVNPAHLEPVTHKDNVLRGESPMAKQAKQTHCKRGHLLPPKNERGKRECAECGRIRAREQSKRLAREV